MRQALIITFFILIMGLSGCDKDEQNHDPTQGHESEHALEHSHGSEADHAHHEEVASLEQGQPEGAGTVTLWTQKTELFMEYPELIVGREAVFAVHLTRMSDFKPVSDSSVEFVFRSERGYEGSLTETGSQTPGIYGPRIIFERAARYDLTIIVEGMVDDTLFVPGIPVYASEHQVPHTHEEEDPNLITFLKEQQWKIPFGTSKVGRHTLIRSVEAHGELRSAENSTIVVSAPMSGIITPKAETNLPFEGTNVDKGMSILTLQPVIQSEGGENYMQQYINAQTELELAQKDLERKESLFARALIAEAELERARVEYRRAFVHFQGIEDIFVADAAAEGREGHEGHKDEASSHAGEAVSEAEFESARSYELRAPISGVVLKRYASPGMQVQAGDPLFVISDLSRIWLEVHLPASERMSVARAGKAVFELQGDDVQYQTSNLNGRVISTGAQVEPENRSISVLYEIDNPAEVFLPGLFAKVYMDTDQKKDVVAVPTSSLIEEEGSFFVFVHKAGELFEKRRVATGLRSRGLVEISDGLEVGEQIVTINPYQVKLASFSTETPAHGHVH